MVLKVVEIGCVDLCSTCFRSKSRERSSVLKLFSSFQRWQSSMFHVAPGFSVFLNNAVEARWRAEDRRVHVVLRGVVHRVRA